MVKLTMGTEAAFALQAKIQAELAARGYSSETDTVMAEYITIMVINDKTAEQINAELADLIGADYDPTFTEWLFSETANSVDTAAPPTAEPSVKKDDDPAEVSQPTSTSRRGSNGGVGLLQSALSGINPPTAPSALRQNTSPSAQKRLASARSPSPSANGPNKSRRTDTPTGPRAMAERAMAERHDRHAPSPGTNQGGRSLIDRVGGHARRGNFNGGHGGLSHAQVSQIQAKIDGITGSQPNAMINLPQGAMPMNPPPMNFTMQEMMLMNWDMMRQMANTLGMLTPNAMGSVPPMGAFGMPQQMPGFVPPMGIPPQQGHGMMGRGSPNRGGGQIGGRGRGHSKQSGAPAQDGLVTSTPSVAPGIPSVAAIPSAPPAQPIPQQPARTPAQEPAPAANHNLPLRPGTPSLCKYGLKCTNPQCRFSHPSPVATVESGVVLSTEFCAQGKDCKNKHCTLGHVSPSVLTNPAPMKPAAQPPSIPTVSSVPTPCKFGLLCTRPGCIFSHPPNFRPSHFQSNQTTSTVPCRFGAACTRGDCSFQHPKGHVPANMFYKGLGSDAPLVEAYVSPHRSVRFGDPQSVTAKDNATKDNKVEETNPLPNDKVAEKTVDVGA